jgi:hypothetical protein
MKKGNWRAGRIGQVGLVLIMLGMIAMLLNGTALQEFNFWLLGGQVVCQLVGIILIVVGIRGNTPKD